MAGHITITVSDGVETIRTDKGGILIFIGAAGFNATNGAIVYTKLAL